MSRPKQSGTPSIGINAPSIDIPNGFEQCLNFAARPDLLVCSCCVSNEEEIHADQTSGTTSSSMGGGGVTSGNLTSIKRPAATSVNTRFSVSSVLVELTCNMRAARITVEDSRKRLSILSPAR